MDSQFKTVMDQTKKHLQMANAKVLHETDQFTFQCQKCGRCCRHRQDILLNPKDLFRISRFFSTTSTIIIQLYGEIYIGHTSHIPVIRLKPTEIQNCPFLKKNHCEIELIKPALCAIYPLGRFVNYEESMTDPKEEIGYFLTQPNCKGQNSTQIHIVQDWIEEHHVEVQDPFFIEWSQIILQLTTKVGEMLNHFDENQMNIIWSIILNKLYLEYDVDKSFLPQFKENWERLQLFLSMIK